MFLHVGNWELLIEMILQGPAMWVVTIIGFVLSIVVIAIELSRSSNGKLRLLKILSFFNNMLGILLISREFFEDKIPWYRHR